MKKIEWSSQKDILSFWESFCKSKENISGKERPDLYLLKGDASTRSYYRITSPSSSSVLCHDASLQSYDHDFLKIQSFLQNHSIRVPDIYAVDLQKNMILQQDVGDQLLLQSLGQSDLLEEKKWYKKAIDLLLQIHSLTEDKGSLSPFSRYFDREKYHFEINWTNTHFIQGLLGHDKHLCSQISNLFLPFILKLSKGPFVFTHRDYHSRNLMVHHDELVVIDFQDARMGPMTYDLASLLDDCYYGVDEENYRELLRYYFDQAPLLKGASFDEFVEIYTLSAIQRLYKAIGTFAAMFVNKNNPSYLKYIGFAFEKMRKIMLPHDHLDSLRKLLTDSYYGY